MVVKGRWGERAENETFTVNSSGHIFTFHGREIDRPKGREDYLLLYIYSGKVKFFFGDRETVCGAGDYVLYAPGEPQRHVYEANYTGQFYYIHFSTQETEWLQLLSMQTSVPYHSSPSSGICDVFEEIIAELQHKNFGYKQVCIGLARKLFVKVRRSISEGELFAVSDELSYAVQYINRNYHEDLTLDEYAKMCGMSKFHFLREFKRIVGQTPLKYRNQIRIAHAEDMLKFTKKTVNIISDQLGFSSPEYFCEVFKKSKGLSPVEYRKMHQSNLTANS
jgi:AraC-like DNA-binding protein